MKEARFIQQRQDEWAAWERWLSPPAGRFARDPAARLDDASSRGIRLDELPSAYRRLCQDLSLARDRNYSNPLVDALHERVLAAHQRLYGARRPMTGQWLEFAVAGLPRLIRQEARFVLAAAALLFVPFLLALFLLQAYPDGVHYLLSPEHLRQYEAMYSPEASRLGQPRDATSDLSMLLFYISHNVRIDFQCFAGGIVFGLGSLFFLAYNGLMIGAAAGHLTHLGYVETFWGFVAGHSAPELLGIVFSGAAGLKIGYALIAPGRLRRADALREAARSAVRLLYGAAALTFAAAFIEALWSPNRLLPFSVKLAVGIAGWVFLLVYFLFAGRKTRAA